MAFLTGVYFLSGACSLIDEVVWVRLLKLVLGNTVYATAVVVSVFLGGLALGALVMGRWAGRVRRPLRLYAAMEAMVAASALALPWALRRVDAAYVWLYRTYSPPPSALLAVQVAASGVLLLAPTMLMGGTLPLLASYVASRRDALGHSVGRLYAANTLGAAAGTFLAGFVLIRTVGVMGTLYVAAALNVLVALAAGALSRASASRADAAEVEPAPAAAAPDIPAPPGRPERPGRRVLLGAFFAAGFVGIGYELIWMRSIVHVLGADTYVFSAVLTVYLLGHMLGAGVGSRLARRVRRPEIAFAAVLTGLGLAGVAYLPWLLAWSARLFPALAPSLARAGEARPQIVALAVPLIHAAACFFVPAVISGLGFPLALQAWHRRRDPGGATGKVYGANTLGAVAGGLATGFVLIPLAGVQGSITILGVCGLAAGAAIWLRARPGGRLAWGVLAPAGVLGVALAVATPADLFRRRFVTYPDSTLLDVAEGVTATVSVHRQADGNRWLCASGMQIAGDGARSVQRTLGHFGMLLNARARTVLSVGFGSGETTACLARHDPRRIDCVEISPEVVALALKHFGHINLGDRLADRVNVTIMDAKNYLHLTDRTYDLIVTDSISPRLFAPNASLYTAEYFRSAADHLNDGGIVTCWLPFCDLPEACFDSILGTFMGVFPHVTMWFPTTRPDHFVLLAGSRRPQHLSVQHVRRTLANDAVGRSLAGIGIRSAQDFLRCYVGDENDLVRYLRAYTPNSDLRPFVEFSTDRPLTDATKWRFLLRLLAAARRPSAGEHLNLAGVAPEEQRRFRDDYRLLYRITTHTLRTQIAHEALRVAGPSAALARLAERALASDGAGGLMASLSEYLARHDDYADGFALRATLHMARSDHAAAIADLDRVIALAPANALALSKRGLSHAAAGQFGRAIADYDRALELEPTYVRVLNNRGAAYCGRGQHRRGLADFDALLRAEPANADARYNRATALVMLGEHAAAIAAYARALTGGPRDVEVYLGRAVAYYRAGRYAEAWRDVRRVRQAGGRIDPGLLDTDDLRRRVGE